MFVIMENIMKCPVFSWGILEWDKIRMKFHKKNLNSLKAEIQVCARAHIYIHIHTEHSKFINLFPMSFFFLRRKAD